LYKKTLERRRNNRYCRRVKEKVINSCKKSIGIDVGVKNLAICSDGMTFKNINKTKRVKRLKK